MIKKICPYFEHKIEIWRDIESVSFNKKKNSQSDFVDEILKFDSFRIFPRKLHKLRGICEFLPIALGWKKT